MTVLEIVLEKDIDILIITYSLLSGKMKEVSVLHQLLLFASMVRKPILTQELGINSRCRQAQLFPQSMLTFLVMATVREAMSQALSAADRDKKKVPSKDALESLVKLTVDEVKTQKKELYCIICYNDFGEANPEGTVEFPLMLPKCKHVFGNLCIKQWFTSNDSCPYCRDILPSESSSRRSAAVEQ